MVDVLQKLVQRFASGAVLDKKESTELQKRKMVETRKFTTWKVEKGPAFGTSRSRYISFSSIFVCNQLMMLLACFPEKRRQPILPTICYGRANGRIPNSRTTNLTFSDKKPTRKTYCLCVLFLSRHIVSRFVAVARCTP